MTITSAEFVQGITGTNPIMTDGKRQIAFIGRSNVGKSSVINSLVNRKDLVRAGSMPGRTKQMDFFIINNEFYFVDLPGYGYAKLSEPERLKLKKMMLWYLFENLDPNKKVVMIIDAEIGPKDSDIEILNMIREYKLNLILIANKIDKIKPKDLMKSINAIKEVFRDIVVVPYSAKTKAGREELLKEINL
jgi:GTP-binding protein